MLRYSPLSLVILFVLHYFLQHWSDYISRSVHSNLVGFWEYESIKYAMRILGKLEIKVVPQMTYFSWLRHYYDIHASNYELKIWKFMTDFEVAANKLPQHWFLLTSRQKRTKICESLWWRWTRPSSSWNHHNQKVKILTRISPILLLFPNRRMNIGTDHRDSNPRKWKDKNVAWENTNSDHPPKVWIVSLVLPAGRRRQNSRWHRSWNRWFLHRLRL